MNDSFFGSEYNCSRSRRRSILIGGLSMGKSKLDVVTFSKLYDMFGEEAARDTLNGVNEGRVRTAP